jgi:hypothetical protein
MPPIFLHQIPQTHEIFELIYDLQSSKFFRSIKNSYDSLIFGPKQQRLMTLRNGKTSNDDLGNQNITRILKTNRNYQFTHMLAF